MSIDIYSPRVMIPALREMKPVRTFLRDSFFPQVATYRTENVDIDVQVKGRRVAPYVNKLGPGKLVERLGFQTSSVAPPCIAMKMPITSQDVSTRVMGESVYQDMDPAARGRILLADDLAELSEMLARRVEIMCRDVIFDSALIISGEDVGTSTITFTRVAALTPATLSGTAAWTHADSDPFAKIDELLELYAKETGYNGVKIIFGGTAYQTFLANAKVKAALDLLRIDLGSLRPADVPNGARLVGALYGGAVTLWTYHEWYDDPANSGTTTALVPAKKILIAADNLRNELRYGAVQDLAADMPTLVSAVALPRSWTTQDPPTRYLELRSRPLPVPIQNHFLTLQVQA